MTSRRQGGGFAVAKIANDGYLSAPLGNVALRASIFHSGQVLSLKQAVGVMSEAQLGAKPAKKEVDDIVAFLHSLTGQLPKIKYPLK
ncbi:hypothetical protein [Bradyrhizobium manausense]|uniref:Cytochrome c domain-containing protein n=1 Tax=Bradyrhizobium manausense TaxID=989370 RepID=A0A0R3CZD6_9BRAD|nr:hypothetical protein [Bradyrhizobium manausense]KRQ02887.1 hypothetical protein AOQ71_34335 [Bradyrhizobium manausense]